MCGVSFLSLIPGVWVLVCDVTGSGFYRARICYFCCCCCRIDRSPSGQLKAMFIHKTNRRSGDLVLGGEKKRRRRKGIEVKRYYIRCRRCHGHLLRQWADQPKSNVVDGKERRRSSNIGFYHWQQKKLSPFRGNVLWDKIESKEEVMKCKMSSLCLWKKKESFWTGWKLLVTRLSLSYFFYFKTRGSQVSELHEVRF